MRLDPNETKPLEPLESFGAMPRPLRSHELTTLSRFTQRHEQKEATLKWDMRVTIQLPDDIWAALGDHWDDVPRRSLEAIAVDAYRTGALTEAQVRRLLGLETRFQVHALLKEHHVPLHYTSADLEDDLRTQRELGILSPR